MSPHCWPMRRVCFGPRWESNRDQFEAGCRRTTGYGRSLQLMAAILHLAILARDAMPRGGKLSFEAAAPTSRSSAEDFVLIAVSASGHGSISDHREPVVRRPWRGRGYRQAIRRAYRSSQRSRPRNVRQNISAARDSRRSVAGRSRQRRRRRGLLIVEDDALVREYVVGQIQSLGYRMLAAGDAREAMTIDRRRREHRSSLHRCGDSRSGDWTRTRDRSDRVAGRC